LQNDQNQQNDGALLTVSGLLNIFYRGRMIVAGLTVLGLIAGVAYGIIVKPLYRATGQVRPGVVSYKPDGRPNREWALEDIVNWFSNFLYWKDFREMPEFADLESAPVIDAAFIPSLNFVAGGNVITLTNLAVDPAVAVRTLDRSIAVFNQQAMADSMGSSLHLTLRRGRSMMRKLRRDIDLVDSKGDRINLEIAQQRRELTMVDLDKKEMELDLQALEAANVWIAEAVAASRHDVGVAQERLVEAEKVLAVVLGHEQDSPGTQGDPSASSDPVSAVLRQTATRELAGRVSELLMTTSDLTMSISEQTIHADSLTARIKSNELEIGRIRLMQDIKVAKDKADIEQKIEDLKITLDKDLPHERDVLKNELETEQMKVELISPLERVGTISVSEKPVRPRKLRAAAISTILAFMGSLFVVLVWEFFRNNRAAITASRPPNV